MLPSKIAVDCVELQTHLENTALRMSQIDRFSDGSGYACLIEIRSRGFTCEHHFHFDDLPNAIAALQAMASGAPGEATLKGRWDQDFVRFTMNRLGHVEVSGEIFEHSELSQSLKFAFRTDQTILEPLIRDLCMIRGT